METEAQVTAAPIEAAQIPPQKETTQPEAKPAGWDQVEIPDDVKPRFNRLYGNMKRYETKANELESVVAKQFEIINQLQDGQNKIVNHLQTADFHDAEGQLKAKRKEAWAKGDADAVDEANDRLAEIKATRIASEKLAAMQSKPVDAPKNNGFMNGKPISGDDAVNQAVEQGAISSSEAEIYRAWQAETDEGGNIRRPWVNEKDQRNTQAAIIGRAVAESPAFANKPLVEKLREVDRLMGLPSKQAGSNVLPAGNLTRTNNKSNIQLSPQIEKLAIRTKFGGPKAKSDADHVEAYRQAMIKSQKGASQ